MVFSHSIFIHSSPASVKELSSPLIPKARQGAICANPTQDNKLVNGDTPCQQPATLSLTVPFQAWGALIHCDRAPRVECGEQKPYTKGALWGWTVPGFPRLLRGHTVMADDEALINISFSE